MSARPFLLLLAALACAPVLPAAPPPPVRAPGLAGTWYPAGADELGRLVDGFLAAPAAPPATTDPGIMACILPHAGYRFSGRTAGLALGALSGATPRRVVVIGPSHRLEIDGFAALPADEAWATPLGVTPLDTAFIADLGRTPVFRPLPAAFTGEHSVEIELPLLQRTLGAFRLVPVVCGRINLAQARLMADALLERLDPGDLVVASSDFTHHGPRYGYAPYPADARGPVRAADLRAWGFIERRDPEGFQAYCDATGITICGRHPLLVLLAMLPPASRPELRGYADSTAVNGDTTDFVCYLSATIRGSWQRPAAAAGLLPLAAEDRRRLLALARQSLAAAVQAGRDHPAATPCADPSPAMRQVMGAFVTLKKDGELRGCIGEILPSRPLFEAVAARAADAGLRDGRFPPLRPGELAGLRLEISALTPGRRVESWRDIVPGRHGIVLSKDGRSAVFLPQVAPEQGWDLPTTLSHLSAKAGLPPDAWQEGASFLVFEAVVFAEDP